jgi:hypothetical protein
MTKNDRTKEPNGIAREISLLLPMVCGRLSEEGIARSRSADSLDIHPAGLQQKLMRLAITAIDGEGFPVAAGDTRAAELRSAN